MKYTNTTRRPLHPVLLIILLIVILTSFDIHANVYEDMSIRITACMPFMVCSEEYTEPTTPPLPPADYGTVTLPTDHY